MSFFRKNFVFFLVFFCGAVVLIIEITATRILAPYFGNTLFTLSSVLGVILGALSLGYYFGGLLADKSPKLSTFFLLIFLAGVFFLLIQVFSKLILPVIGEVFEIKSGPFIASLILFFFPSLILGMVSPLALKLETFELEEIGRTSGKVFFWSTLGSISGSFLTGFFLIPHWGISKIIVATGSSFIFIGLLGFFFSEKELIKLKKSQFFSLLMVIFLFSYLTLLLPPSPAILFQKDGLYERITVEEGQIKDQGARILRLDRSYEGAIFLNSDELPFNYTKYYLLYRLLNPQAEKALFLGEGAYTVPRRLLLEQNNLKKVEVVEIEPQLYSLAQQYFGLPQDPRLFNHIDDGRHFLKRTKENYDLIFADVFYSLFSIPSHFTTQEFFSLAKSKLSDNGIFLMNLIGKLEGKGSLLLLSEIKTFSSVFENHYLFAVSSPDKEGIQNFILVGLKNNSQKINFESEEILENEEEIIRSLPQKLVKLKKEDLNSVPLLTDDFAPIESLTAKIF